MQELLLRLKRLVEHQNEHKTSESAESRDDVCMTMIRLLEGRVDVIRRPDPEIPDTTVLRPESITSTHDHEAPTMSPTTSQRLAAELVASWYTYLDDASMMPDELLECTASTQPAYCRMPFVAQPTTSYAYPQSQATSGLGLDTSDYARGDLIPPFGTWDGST